MKAGFILYADQYAPIAALTHEQKGILLDAFFAFNMGQEVSFTDPVLTMAFAFFRQAFERDTDAYDRKCQKNRDNVNSRYTKSTTVDDGNRSNTNATNIIQPDNKITREEIRTPLTPHGGDGACDAADASAQGQTPAKPTRTRKAIAYSADFEGFWACYPRKIGKDSAWKVYQRRKHEIPKGEDMAAILARHSQTEQWQRDGGQYVPHPATWLNQGRWQDDVGNHGPATQDPVGW